jgi:hypothetical protein
MYSSMSLYGDIFSRVIVPLEGGRPLVSSTGGIGRCASRLLAVPQAAYYIYSARSFWMAFAIAFHRLATGFYAYPALLCTRLPSA